MHANPDRAVKIVASLSIVCVKPADTDVEMLFMGVMAESRR
ncbi:MAG: hypothetical protein ACKVQU_19120 [Burkholderiales bacterium]